jgi:hypothetical protein
MKSLDQDLQAGKDINWDLPGRASKLPLAGKPPDLMEKFYNYVPPHKIGSYFYQGFPQTKPHPGVYRSPEGVTRY